IGTATAFSGKTEFDSALALGLFDTGRRCTFDHQGRGYVFVCGNRVAFAPANLHLSYAAGFHVRDFAVQAAIFVRYWISVELPGAVFYSMVAAAISQTVPSPI